MSTCWMKDCDLPGARRLHTHTAKGTVEAHWYCERHAPWVEEHTRVVERILRIPARR